MKLKIWWGWVNSKPLYLRWFIYFLLIRPVAEQFYNLKEVSPLVSPLYWLGVLTLVFSVIGILNGKRIKSGLDLTFSYWAFLCFFSVIALYLGSSKIINFLNYSIKLTIPVLVYYFLRVFIRNKSDFTGLLTTFLLSCIYPIVYLIIGLSGGANLNEGRYAGAYSDVFNNAFYISMGTITLLYHYVLNRASHNTLKIRNLIIISGFAVIILGLWVIKHIATVAVLISVIAIFIYVVFRRYHQAAIFLIVLSFGIIFFAGDRFYNEVLNPRLEKEIEIVEGSRGISQGIHGRMTRWTWLFSEFKSAPFYAQVAGYPYTLKYSNHMIGITPHNDFLRVMFFSGYAGLTIYLILLFKVFKRIKYKDIPDRFFLYAILMATILYSITTVPTFYPGYVNILMITFAYCALPQSKPVSSVQT